MNIPYKTLKSGFAMPVYGLGTYMMGGKTEADYANDKTEIAGIRYAIDAGITHIDTAELYGNGHAEELIAQAKQGVNRSELFLTSKVLSGMNEGYEGVLRACEKSLKRLKTDYLDLYLIHYYPPKGVPVREIMQAMDELVERGWVRNIGVSNFTLSRLYEAQKYTKNKLVCNQLHYSLECREATERGIVQYCQQNDVLVTAWGPLSKGSLERADVLTEMAQKYGKTPYQVALNWLVTQPNVITIPKTSSPEHLDENLGALGWELAKEDWQKLADEFPGQTVRSDRVPLDYEADVEP